MCKLLLKTLGRDDDHRLRLMGSLIEEGKIAQEYNNKVAHKTRTNKVYTQCKLMIRTQKALLQEVRGVLRLAEDIRRARG